MAFPPKHNFHGQGTYFESLRPFALGLANQQVYGYGPDGQGDKIVDYMNDKLSGVCKDPSFDNRNWYSASAVTTPSTRLVPADSTPANLQVPKSLVPEILIIVGIAVVAAILAYVRPDLFADLFKLFLGYEVLALLVGAGLVLLLLVVYLMGYHKTA